MTVRSINLITGEETVREYTQEELDAISSVPQPDPQAEVSAKLSKVREVRERYLGRILGIKDAARDAGDTVLVDACRVARQSLLDITAGCPADPALVDAFILNKYSTIVSTVRNTAPELISAFAGVDA